MKVLFIGDIVGPDAVDYVVRRLPELREEHRVDVVIANAENCCVSKRTPFGGFGMEAGSIDRLFATGVDVITSGNHAWDAPDADRVLAHPRVIRPFNVPGHLAGTGIVTIPVGDEALTVVNIADAAAIPAVTPAYPSMLDLDFQGTVIVDFHGGEAMDKFGCAYALDGQVAAVLGTHTHEPSLTLHRLPGGTAFVLDVGMTGPSGGWQGIDPLHMLAHYRNESTEGYPPYQLAAGPIQLGAVLLTIEDGLTTDIARLD
ncbi:MAG TPA: YmdB family metallophosphoesterase [Thermomicrobiales bacterium]|nr:YmdB family metallophosphoesterase [Thermomicrobiales bacterium]